MSKSDQLDVLYKEYKNKFSDKEVVTGAGSCDTRLLLVGEAPGKDEVRLSKPFVGAAGKNLSEFLDILGLDRQCIYITNAIKYRLSKLNPQTGRLINRPALNEEVKSNREYLLNEIKIIKPSYIATLGNVSLKALINEPVTIGSVHGSLIDLSIEGIEYSLFPLYHPASIIYNRSLKDVYINDIQKLKTIMDL